MFIMLKFSIRYIFSVYSIYLNTIKYDIWFKLGYFYIIRVKSIKSIYTTKIHIPIFTFINKMDREANDTFDLLDEIEKELGIATCPINWPIGSGKGFKGVYDRCDIMPLGAGALAGTTFPIDRPFVAEQLNFASIYSNSLDAVSDRDYIMEFLSAASILMVHLSRLSEETILWCSREFFFIELDDAHCTGSSMMPQKKNPDVSELVRGKTGRVMGHLMAMLTTVKGLPLAYNKDLQEDKEGIFDAIDTIKFSLAVYARIMRGMKVRKDVMRRAVAEDFSNATDLADYLVKKGLPFRQAHAVSGKAVHYCIEQNKWLADMTMAELKELSDLFEEDIYDAISPETCVKNRNSYGGTSYQQVEMQLKLAADIMADEKAYVAEKDAKQAKVEL